MKTTARPLSKNLLSYHANTRFLFVGRPTYDGTRKFTEFLLCSLRSPCSVTQRHEARIFVRTFLSILSTVGFVATLGGV